jgi:hypothetical protein
LESQEKKKIGDQLRKQSDRITHAPSSRKSSAGGDPIVEASKIWEEGMKALGNTPGFTVESDPEV